MKKKKIGSTPQIRKQITFSCLFPDDKESNINILLKDIPTHSAIEFITYWNFLETTKDEKHDSLFNFMSILFKLDPTLQHIIAEYLQRINLQEYNFVDRYALLKLSEELILRNNRQTRELTNIDYSNLLKAYLICCEGIVIPNLTEQSIKTIIPFLHIYIPFQMKQNDLDYPLIYADVEIIKFYCFMNFCRSNELFDKYLSIYLKEYGLSNWIDYLYTLFRLFLEMQINESGKTNKVVVDKEYIYLKSILNDMCINNETHLEFSNDFIKIRANPIFRLDEDTYTVIFIKFFKDKFFQSFLFDLARVLSLHKDESGVSGYLQLKQLLGQHFSEQILFCQVMNRCFMKPSFVKYSGVVLKDTLIDGEPDFYMRDASRIFLFEYKDIKLNAKIKSSDNYDMIEQELKEQFVESTFDKFNDKKKKKRKPKGVIQLLNTIVDKLPIIFQKLDVIPRGHLSIFPIIVYQDSCLDIDGINYIINEKFIELKKLHNLNEYTVKDVVMVNIDTLIKLENIFSRGKLNLGTCINRYMAYKQSKEFNSIMSFNRYLMLQAFDKGYNLKFTKWFKDIMNSLEEPN